MDSKRARINFLGIKQDPAIIFTLKIIFQMNFSDLLDVWTARNITEKCRVYFVRILGFCFITLYTTRIAGWF